MQRKYPVGRIRDLGEVVTNSEQCSVADRFDGSWRSWAPSSSLVKGSGWCRRPGCDTEFGRIAAGLGERQLETEFQAGLRRFSYLLLRVRGWP